MRCQETTCGDKKKQALLSSSKDMILPFTNNLVVDYTSIEEIRSALFPSHGEKGFFTEYPSGFS
jgi:hypothetical protein